LFKRTSSTAIAAPGRARYNRLPDDAGPRCSAVRRTALRSPRRRAGAGRAPYLYLHHPLYAEIDLLLERGVLRGLSPVVRPYRRGDIARAVQRADTSRASVAERGWLARLRRALRPELEALAQGGERTRVAVEGVVSVTGRTHAHRDLLRPEKAGRADLSGELDLRAAFPGVVAESHLRSDNHYWHDPQVASRVTANASRERAEDAYLELQGRYARLLVGRLYRNWAPSRVMCVATWRCTGSTGNRAPTSRCTWRRVCCMAVSAATSSSSS